MCSHNNYDLLYICCTWCPNKWGVPVPHQDDDGDESQDDPQWGEADGQDGKYWAPRHVLDLSWIDSKYKDSKKVF